MNKYKIHKQGVRQSRKEFRLITLAFQVELGTDDENEKVYQLKKFITTDIFPEENIEIYQVRLTVMENNSNEVEVKSEDVKYTELKNIQLLDKVLENTQDIYLLVEQREFGRVLTTYGNTIRGSLQEPKGMCLVGNVFYVIAGDSGSPESSIYRVDRSDRDKVEFFSVRKRDISKEASFEERVDNMVSIRYPKHICFSELRNELYIAECKTIKVCSTDGVLIREFGSDILKNCRGMCISEENNNIYVSDISKKVIFVFSLEGQYIDKIEGIDSPSGICFSKTENLIYVINDQYKNRCIKVFSYTQLVRSFGNENLESPSYICMNEEEDTIYVSDRDAVKVFSKDGTFQGTIGKLPTPKKNDRESRIIGASYGGKPIAEILNPAGLVVSKHKLYVADRHERILCFHV